MFFLLFLFGMYEKAWLDVSVVRCPNCGRLYVDASWYVIMMESDIECKDCGYVFNSKKNVIDRVMLLFKIVNERKVEDVEIYEHIPIEEL